MSATINNDIELNKSSTEDIEAMKQETKNLKKIVWGFATVTILLLGSMVGVSIATARLSKEFTVDPSTGFAMASSSHQILKTELALERGLDFSISMDDDELGSIQAITLLDGDIRFLTFGYARGNENSVTLIVQGGSITVDADGVESATGDAAVILEDAGILEEGTGRRILRAAMHDIPHRPPMVGGGHRGLSGRAMLDTPGGTERRELENQENVRNDKQGRLTEMAILHNRGLSSTGIKVDCFPIVRL